MIKAKCDYLRGVDECSLNPNTCNSTDGNGYCLAVVIDNDEQGGR